MKQLAQKRIIGVTSEIAGGTTTFAKYAKENFSASTHRFSVPLRDIINILHNKKNTQHLERIAERLYLLKTQKTLDTLLLCFQKEFGEHFAKNIFENRESLQRLSTALRKTLGEDCMAKAIFGDVYRDKSNLIVVEGIRRLMDIKILGNIQGFKLVYVDATPEIRWERINARKQYADETGLTYEGFLEVCSHESEQQIRNLKEHAHIIIDSNPEEGEGNKECLARYYKKIEKILIE